MDTAPKDQSRLTWNAPKPEPAPSRPRDHVWTVTKAGDRIVAELLQQPDGAIELLLSRNGAWYTAGGTTPR